MLICLGKMSSIITIFMLVFFLACNASSGKYYQPFNLARCDIQAILNNNIVVATATKLPADISFLCADLKYKDGVLKFCELGDAVYMSLMRDMTLEIDGQIKHIHGPSWGLFWHYLKQFGIPVWFVGHIPNANVLALDELKKTGGRYVENLDSLEKNNEFCKTLDKNFIATTCIAKYRGIIIYSAPPGSQRDGQKILDFKNRNPECIFVNSALRNIATRKDSTYKLFCDAKLTDYIPSTKFYDKIYSHQLVHNILRDFSGDYLVIKPIAGTYSQGVTIISRGELNELLSVILASDTRKLSTHHLPWLSEWANDKDSRFMVSEYVPSTTLIRGGKPYNPTMRIMCMLHHDQGGLQVTVVGGFWKIPVRSLVDNVPLTEKHVTRAHLIIADPDAFHRGILVQKDDMDAVRKILHYCLPRLYEKILM